MQTPNIQKHKKGRIEYKLSEKGRINLGVLKRLEAKAKAISSGKRKTTRFRTIQELDRIIKQQLTW